MGPLGDGRSPELPGTGCVTGNSVLQQEPQEEHQRHHHVADGVEDDGTLRVAEARHVDEEGQEGEEGGGQADDGHHSDEVAGERQLLPREVHVGTRRGAVAHPHEGVAELRLDLQLPRAPEAVVPLDGHGGLRHGRGGQEVEEAGVGLLAVGKPEAEHGFRIKDETEGNRFCCSLQRGEGKGREGGRGVCGGGASLLCQPVAVHLLRPADTEHVHELVAVAPGLQAEAAAGQGHPPVLGADGGVEGAQEHPEVRGALQVHHGMEGLQEETQTNT